MKVIVNGFEKDYTKEEIEYLKKIYGSYEEVDGVMVFKRLDFLNVGEISEIIGITNKAVYQRYSRDADRYPLVKRGIILGIDSDKFLKYWVC